ncbi:MAG: magnesium-translocating P-type ATPase [Clostridiales bacterium]|jgi:Mg2+-importing ATPase|nr:magnesium-translocating P-type ATPase [Clostridiales bacterium]
MKLFVRKNRKNPKIQHRREASDAFLRKHAFLPIEEVYAALGATSNGFTEEQAQEKRDEFGKNKITAGVKNSTARRLRESAINPFNIVLLIIAAITFVTDVVIADTPDPLTASIILLLVIISSTVAFVQSQRSNAAAEKLSGMISNQANVLRDGAFGEIALDGIVPGDIVRLSAGDMIPADVRFLATKDTFIAQAALTGESNPVEKFKNSRSRPDDALTDLQNIGFMGSNVISGSATALVLATGNETYFGSMAKSLSGDRAKNSFERGVGAIGGLLIKLMLVMVPIVFLLNGFIKQDWLEALLFAITLAVGLTPEMLPVIMTSTLAKGAMSMSKSGVIVKTLGAIQTFGEMDVLCTDKTGTLTEDKIILEKYMNVDGDDDTRILRHAYLNSYFQTGLKNLIDIAIINRASENGFEDILQKYVCVDEIPFDFSRRRMSVSLQSANGKRQLITKGAVEEILAICAFVEMDGKILPLSEETRARAMRTYEKNNTGGLRMLAVAQKNDVPDARNLGVEDESDMVLIGFVGFLDPPKESAKTAIAALKEHGVRTVVLTGDSAGVAVKVCQKVGVDVTRCLTGKDVGGMTDGELSKATEECSLFSKLSPSQKERVVKALQVNGHIVGYMGDGINDAPPLHQADVGISVDSAVDIAKETADIILLKKDLMVLEQGVIEGRRTFGNIIKYIKMAASGNFGNMISVIAASIFLPFLPMLPVHILTQNLLCDFSQMGIPFDSVDNEYIKKPRKWETKSIKTFMAVLGPLSSLFDIACFIVMWFAIGANKPELAPLFQGGWFLFGTISQVLVIHMIRTAKMPFIKSRPSVALYVSTFAVTAVALIIGFTSLANGFDMAKLPLIFIPWLAGLLLLYFVFTQLIKTLYVKRFGEWL